MNKQTSPGDVGDHSELHGVHSHQASSKGNTDHAALDPEQSETIRGFAEHIVRQLCARHSDQQDKSEQKYGFSNAGN
ncbi:hypothetical protein HUU62_24595 [Rhodoferax sp. 4810]|nr:hypothetical protein [Rhodoferax jenense]